MTPVQEKDIAHPNIKIFELKYFYSTWLEIFMHNYQQKQYYKYIYFIYLLSVFFIVTPVEAEEILITPTLEVSGAYDSNIQFESNDEKADYSHIAIPKLNMAMGSERYNMGVTAQILFLRYSKEKDLDTEKYQCQLSGDYRLTQKTSIATSASYTRDTTLDSELEETGRVTKRENRERYFYEASSFHRLSELSDINFLYRYTKIEYESEKLVDRDGHGIDALYQRWFNDRLDTLIIKPSFYRSDTDDKTTLSYYGASIGWAHTFSDTLAMSNLIGYGNTVTETDTNNTIDQTISVNISLINSGEIFFFRTGFQSNIRIDSEGDLIEVDRLYFKSTRALTERVRFSFDANLYLTRQVDVYDDYDSIYYDIKPGLSYAVTEKWYLSAFYRYSYEYDNMVNENQSLDRYVVGFTLSYSFRKEL